MESRKVRHAKRNLARRRKSAIKRFFLVTLTILIMLSGVGIDNEVNAQYVVPIEKIPKLQKVGPLHQDNKYPVWYKDSKDQKLQLCLDGSNPLCGFAPADLPDPNNPIFSLKDGNFPEEAFYQLASAEIDMPSGGRAVAVFALEAAWANEIVQDGDQIVFGRVRIRIDDLQTGEEYTVTHPYGVDKFEAVAENEDNPEIGEIRFVEDIGITGGFEGPMKSRIGTFLEWDEGAPEGYVGDPGTEHKIKNGYYNGEEEQNYFRIQGPGIGSDGTCGPDCIQTDLFSLMGKKADNSGVDIVKATYNQANADGGTIDVFASTAEGDVENIQVKIGDNGTPVKLFGEKGQYFARIDYSGSPPEKITVTNISDTPDSVKTIKPKDRVTATAEYNVDSKKLTVLASSSDEVKNPTLTVSGFGDINDGKLEVTPTYLPPNITITSAAEGTVTVPVHVSGIEAGKPAPVSIVEVAGGETTVRVGSEVKLLGSNTGGEFTQAEWKQIKPVTPNVDLVVDAENPLSAKFIAPATPGELVFQLTLTGPGGESTSNVMVTVVEDVPTANAGGDQSVAQDTLVTLDGSASKNTSVYRWDQIGGPKEVTLNLTNPAKPTFTAPKINGTFSFKLTAKGEGTTESTDYVTITTLPDELNVTTAEYNVRDRTWKIDGSSTVFGPGVTISIYIGEESANNLLTKVNVGATGAFRFRNTGIAITSTQILTFVSSSGGRLTMQNGQFRIR